MPTGSSLAFLELPDARLAAVGQDRVIISADHGASWAAVGPPMPITPLGMIYSPYRKSFFIWHFDCGSSTIYPIQPDSIMRLHFDPTVH